MRQVRSKVHVAVAVSHFSILFPYSLGASLAYFLFSDLAGPGCHIHGLCLVHGYFHEHYSFPVLARISGPRHNKNFLGSTAITCASVDDVTAWRSWPL